MAYSCVRVHFEIGHVADIRTQRTPKGFTHDWELFVRGADNADIQHFVEKVVFHLHSTFPNPKRIIKEPPYVVKESGYAGFNLPIDIYLKTKDENRKLRFNYDLTLQKIGPRISHVVKEKADFLNPAKEFRRRLIRGGGVGVGNEGVSSIPDKLPHNNNVSNSHLEDTKLSSSPHLSKPKVNNNNGEQLPKKHKPKESLKAEDSRVSNSFAALFGTPIKTGKYSPNPTKPPSRPPSSSSDRHEKQVKESTKVPKHSPHKDKEKDNIGNATSSKRDKDAEKSVTKDKEKSKDKDQHKEKVKEKIKKPSSPLPIPKEQLRKEENNKKIALDEVREKPTLNTSKSESTKGEKKHKEKKNKEEKEKKEKHKEKEKEKDVEKKEIEKLKVPEKVEKKIDIIKEPKEKNKEHSKRNSVEKEDKKMRAHEKEKEKSHDPEKPKHKHKKKDKHKKDEEREKKKEKKELEKFMEKSPPKPISPSKSPSPVPPPRTKPLNMLFKELLSDKDTDSDFSDVERKPELQALSPLSTPPPPPIPVKEEEFKPVVLKEEKKKKEKRPKGEKEESKKRKRKSKDKEEVSPAKIVKVETKEEIEEESSPPSSTSQTSSSTRRQQTSSPAAPLSEDYVTQLKDLQRRIMTIEDNAELQRVVQVVSETGQYVITQRTFDFDLVALDPSIIKRLQDILVTAS